MQEEILALGLEKLEANKLEEHFVFSHFYNVEAGRMERQGKLTFRSVSDIGGGSMNAE
jgi:hypothetical protein